MKKRHKTDYGFLWFWLSYLVFIFLLVFLVARTTPRLSAAVNHFADTSKKVQELKAPRYTFRAFKFPHPDDPHGWVKEPYQYNHFRRPI